MSCQMLFAGNCIMGISYVINFSYFLHRKGKNTCHSFKKRRGDAKTNIDKILIGILKQFISYPYVNVRYLD